VVALALLGAALAAPIGFDRVDILAADPGTFLAWDLPDVAAEPRLAAVRFLLQVEPVWRMPIPGLYVGTSLASQSLVWETPLAERPRLIFSAGLQTRLLLPAGLTTQLAWRAGPVRVGLGANLLSAATWSHPSWSRWRVLPGLSVGVGRRSD
jgi:hypothetical protein